MSYAIVVPDRPQPTMKIGRSIDVGPPIPTNKFNALEVTMIVASGSDFLLDTSIVAASNGIEHG
jgi:hypothetical protein